MKDTTRAAIDASLAAFVAMGVAGYVVWMFRDGSGWSSSAVQFLLALAVIVPLWAVGVYRAYRPSRRSW
ncbi:hypothetical protein [Demequina mangrovi]|uniref:Uncharacterized protein n=1 Tax=Demequina mangrovi TaxID=1043493 RepID=A0A1H6ZHG9_9MICO|nr:hypothetical protein [Demequina mangrovi]SEJ50957.1 hypothetical protein SAMN05421637_2073 [Demequina mangrovi]